MNPAERERLEASGFCVGSAADLLGLSPAEAALVELKLALTAGLKRRRRESRLTQAALAERLQSSQSRVAKMEAGDPSVSLDLLIHALLAAGATRAELGALIGS